MRDHSALLCDLFDRSIPYLSRCDSFAHLNALRAHAFFQAFDVATRTAENAMNASRLSVVAALHAMKALLPDVSDLESALLFREAELLSASNAIKDLLATMKEAGDKMKDLTGTWGALLSAAKRKHKGSSSCFEPSQQFLEHLETGLDVLAVGVGRWRLKIGLCKEELALYKQEMFAFPRAGILSCPSIEDRYVGGGPSPAFDKVAEAEGAEALSLAQLGDHKGRKVTKVVASVVGRAIKEAVRTVAAAPVPAKKDISLLLSKSKSNEGVLSGVGRVTPSKFTVPDFNYTAEEEKKLNEANQMLMYEQQQAVANDAKAVEVSVRELSQLTSIMSERLVQQNEQFSILLKNTEVAHSNIQKGVGEVNKTLSHFWNSTRQLIACLWISIIVLLVSNWVIR